MEKIINSKGIENLIGKSYSTIGEEVFKFL